VGGDDRTVSVQSLWFAKRNYPPNYPNTNLALNERHTKGY